MNFFKALKKLIHHLTRDENMVEYEQFLVKEKPNPEQEPVKIQENCTLETNIEAESVSQVRDWAIKKIELLHEADRHRNARALAAEFDEWINIPDGVEELDYLCIEDQEWTGDQEIDVR